MRSGTTTSVKIGMFQSSMMTKKPNSRCAKVVKRKTTSFNFSVASFILFMMTKSISRNDILLLRILTGKKHPKIKPQGLRKMRIWTFGSLVHQISSS